MRVLLDTNVLVSAVTTRGLCADLFRMVLAGHDLVTCTTVLHEVERILKGKFSVPPDMVAEYLELIGGDSILVESPPHAGFGVKDAADAAILSAAVAARADALVTGDRELQELRRVEKVRILSPRAFWEKLATRKGKGLRVDR
jgi:putative PIN family toxin of toxin-antitoxin system